MKRSGLFLSRVLLLLLAFPMVLYPACADNPLTVYFEGKPADWGNKLYIDASAGTTMVPLRAFSEATGAKVIWDEKDNSIQIQKGNGNIVVHLGVHEAMIDGVSEFLDSPPVLQEGSTFVPLRFLAERLCYSVSWDEASQTVNIRETDSASAQPLFFNPLSLDKLQNAGIFAPEASEAAKSVVHIANGYLNVDNLSVVQKSSPQYSADPHDFVSMAIYYWPDPNKPGGTPYISKDGLINPEKDNDALYDAHRKDKMINMVQYLSEAYWLTKDEKYATKAEELLRVWFLDADTRMNPNFNRAQLVPGKNQGSSTGLIDAVTMISLVDSVRLLESSSSWNTSDEKGLKQWFSDFSDWMLNSSFGKKERAEKNNHGVWYHAQLADYLWFADRADEAKVIVREGRELVQHQIEKDGSMPLELARTRSMHYLIYNLEAFSTLSRIGELVGENLFDFQTDDGRGVKTAFEWLLPYLLGEKKWEHKTIVKENESGFAPYLLTAARVYQNPKFANAAAELLGDDKGKIRLASFTLSP